MQRYLHGSGLNALLPQVREAYAGFGTGYNRYLKSGKLRDPACKGKPWVRPITFTDLLPARRADRHRGLRRPRSASGLTRCRQLATCRSASPLRR